MFLKMAQLIWPEVGNTKIKIQIEKKNFLCENSLEVFLFKELLKLSGKWEKKRNKIGTRLAAKKDWSLEEEEGGR